jgi:D-3-phosphoglycerate dehydrogenase
VDNIDLVATEELSIRVEIAHGANAQGVAELALALILAGLRDVPWSDHLTKKGKWERRKGIEVQGRLLGVIGCGQIGKRLIKMALGIGMCVCGYDPYQDHKFKPEGGFSYLPFDEIIENADIISLHCPPGDKPLINRKTIDKMKGGVFLVNTARAGLVDNEAVLHALNTGKMRGFATDVYEQEPPAMSALIKHELVITTPHVGGFTEESVRRAAEMAVDNLLKILDG